MGFSADRKIQTEVFITNTVKRYKTDSAGLAGDLEITFPASPFTFVFMNYKFFGFSAVCEDGSFLITKTGKNLGTV